MRSETSGTGVAVAGALLRLVHALVDLRRVLVSGALVDLVADLLESLVDLLVVLVEEVLGLVHEAHRLTFRCARIFATAWILGSSAIFSRPLLSGIRQFGYSSIVPGRLGW